MEGQVEGFGGDGNAVSVVLWMLEDHVRLLSSTCCGDLIAVMGVIAWWREGLLAKLCLLWMTVALWN